MKDVQITICGGTPTTEAMVEIEAFGDHLQKHGGYHSDTVVEGCRFCIERASRRERNQRGTRSD